MADYGNRKPVRMSDTSEKISEAIESGDRLRELQALRAVRATHLDNAYTPASAVSALARQYRDLSEEIEKLEAQTEDLAESDSHEADISDAEWTLHAI